jgi:hypothetical protein
MAAEQVKNLIDNAPENTGAGAPQGADQTTTQTTDFDALLQGVDLNALLEHDSIRKLVQAQSDKRVTQALATARAKWEQEQAAAQTEAEKLKKMTAEQQEKYKLDQEKAAFEKEKANFQHAQLVLETQRQMIGAGLPDLAEFITGATAEETTANLATVTQTLAAWQQAQLKHAMRGTAPTDTTPKDTAKLTREQIAKMSPAEINAAWEAGKIDTGSLK